MNLNAVMTPFKCVVYHGHMDKNMIVLIDSERHFVRKGTTLSTGCVLSENVR